MNNQVNAKQAVATLKSFIEAHGGAAQHSEMLELVAHMQGFASYRAMNTVTKQSGSKSFSPSSPNDRNIPEGFRPFENEENVVFRSTAVDWRLAEDPEIGLDEVPESQRTKYEVVLENCGEQFRLLMAPVGVGIDNFQGRAVLDIFLEVNHGVPCVHMTNDPNDSMALTVFATGKGLLVRPDDAKWAPANDASVPADIGELALDACQQSELAQSHVAILDTEAKYSDEAYGVTELRERAVKGYVELCVTDALDDVDCSLSTQKHREKQLANYERKLREKDREEGDRRVKVILATHTHTASGAPIEAKLQAGLPEVRTDLVNPVKRRLIGSCVQVSFADDIDEDRKQLWIDVDLLDRKGSLVDDDEHCGGLCAYDIGTSPVVLKQLATTLSELVAFFAEADYSLRQMESIILPITQAATGNPLEITKASLELAKSAEDKHEAYKQVVISLHSYN